MTYTPRFNYIPERTAEECLWLWPTVVHRAAPGQDQDFALKIEQQAMRPDWEPSPLQLGFMRRLVSLYAPDGTRLDPEMLALAAAVRALG
ncbi:hypothetical protein [Pararhodobacter aggregans]